jgi:hypothetical protein
MKKPVVRKLRCAVYTRKSSEEGLEQEFNSLHAQREACEAYIASQRPEGWVLVPDRHDDGGISGVTLERPALKRLLADIEAQRVDVVVVYKRVPISIRRRGGRKLVLAPDGRNVTTVPVTRHIDNAMVKTIARAFRWRHMLESGQYATIREIAEAEKISETYVGRVLRLTLLTPGIVQAILDGRQPPELQLDTILHRFPVDWSGQEKAFQDAAVCTAASGEYRN